MTKENKERFFTALSLETGMMISNSTTRQVYNAIIRLIQQELPMRKTFELPDLGTFNLVESKKEIVNKYDPRTGTTRPVAVAAAVRFSTDYKLKYYCRNAGN